MSSFTDTYSHHNQFKSSNAPKSNQSNNNYNNSQNVSKPNDHAFDFFAEPVNNNNNNFNNPVPNNNQNQAPSQNIKTANDIFDLFSQPVASQNAPVNTFSNVSSNANPGSNFDDIFSVGSSSNNNQISANFTNPQNTNINTNTNTDSKKQINLEDLLKNAYSNNTATDNTVNFSNQQQQPNYQMVIL